MKPIGLSMSQSLLIAKEEMRAAKLLAAISARIGFTPNIASQLADQPDLLALVARMICIGEEELAPAIQRSLGIAIAQEHASVYGLSMQAYLATHTTKLSACEIALNREGSSDDARTDPLVRFAVRTVRTGGHIEAGDLALLQSAGLSPSGVSMLLLAITRFVVADLLANLLGPSLDFPRYPLLDGTDL